MIDPTLIIKIFEMCLDGFKEADEWFKVKKKKYDFFGNAARQYAKRIEEQYGTIRIFGMTKPVPLEKIYTRINILNKITARQRTSLEELEKQFDWDRRSYSTKHESRAGIEVVNELQKFILLGKPGSGKTTFLKHIALQAVQGKLAEVRVPVFIELKEFSDSNNLLMDFIVNQFDICLFKDAKPFVERMLLKGKLMLLFDGLDEVSQDKQNKIIRQIKSFSDKYTNNKFILSCRIASCNYVFEKFTDVEIADFNNEQIEIFINNWFGKGTEKAQLCLKELNKKESTKELASTPLLLAMLCLLFDETMSFPSNKPELYLEATNALLGKWDESKGIERDGIYRNLSPKRKESMLSRIAATSFEKKQFFLSQRKLEKAITDFVINLPKPNPEMLEPDSKAILKAIEIQHGLLVERAKRIYSFSHRCLQEYFTAKYIVHNVNKGALEKLVENHFTDYRWRHVFLLCLGMLDEADSFLLSMNQKIDSLANGGLVAAILKAIQLEGMNKEIPYVPAANRAAAIAMITGSKYWDERYHWNLDLDVAEELAVDIIISLTYPEGQPCSIHGSPVSYELTLIENDLTHTLKFAFSKAFDVDFSIYSDLDSKFSVLIKYLYANLLLMSCLNIKRSISKSISQKILDKLLTPP